MQRTFSPCYIPDTHWKQISAPYPPYPVISLMSNFLELWPTVQAPLPRARRCTRYITLHHVTTLPRWTVEQLFFQALILSILYSFHFIPFLVAASAALKSHCPATLGGLLGHLTASYCFCIFSQERCGKMMLPKSLKWCDIMPQRFSSLGAKSHGRSKRHPQT